MLVLCLTMTAVWRPASDELVGGDRELADPSTAGVEDRVCDGRIDAGGAELADAGGDVGVDGQSDARQVLGQPAPKALVVAAGFHRCLAPAPYDAAENLRA